MGVSIKRKPIPLNKTKRVFKNKADKALQNKMEGKNTFFQMKLRANEAAGNSEFDFNGRPIAAATANLPTKRATLPPPKLTPPAGGPIVGSKPQPFPVTTTPVKGNVKGNKKQKKLKSLKNTPVNSRVVKNISPTGTGQGSLGRMFGRTGTKTGTITKRK